MSKGRKSYTPTLQERMEQARNAKLGIKQEKKPKKIKTNKKPTDITWSRGVNSFIKATWEGGIVEEFFDGSGYTITFPKGEYDFSPDGFYTPNKVTWKQEYPETPPPDTTDEFVDDWIKKNA